MASGRGPAWDMMLREIGPQPKSPRDGGDPTAWKQWHGAKDMWQYRNAGRLGAKRPEDLGIYDKKEMGKAGYGKFNDRWFQDRQNEFIGGETKIHRSGGR